MPPPISDRYRLEMRLGRDGDIEEWLATDTSLERPVLIRSVGPESSDERRAEFVRLVGEAAKASHPHLARVYEVETVEGGAYSVSEWVGGATLFDRVSAGGVVDLEEFLPNAAGLFGALAMLHATGTSHGNIDLSSIGYSVAHPAKLGAFGRPQSTGQNGDVRALSAVLESAITGAAPGGPPPSESIDGFPRSLDRILRAGQAGGLSAGEMEKAFLAAPTPRRARPEPRATSRRVLIIAASLVLIAVGLVAVGRLFTGGGPILPITPTTHASTGDPDSTTTTSAPPPPISVASINTYDPFGEGGENDDLIPNLVDGQGETSWRTESYQTALQATKPGVGLRFQLVGTPSLLVLLGFSPGTAFELRWSDAVGPRPEQWERILGGRAPNGTVSLSLPPRTGGHWLIWMTDLPQLPDGDFAAAISEVRFQP